MAKSFIARFPDVPARDAFLRALEGAHLRSDSVYPAEFLPDVVFRNVAETVADEVKSLISTRRGQVFDDIQFDLFA
jgi:hypothetical protein